MSSFAGPVRATPLMNSFAGPLGSDSVFSAR